MLYLQHYSWTALEASSNSSQLPTAFQYCIQPYDLILGDVTFYQAAAIGTLLRASKAENYDECLQSFWGGVLLSEQIERSNVRIGFQLTISPPCVLTSAGVLDLVFPTSLWHHGGVNHANANSHYT